MESERKVNMAIYEIERKATVAESRQAWTKEAAALQSQTEIMRIIQASDKNSGSTPREFQKEVT